MMSEDEFVVLMEHAGLVDSFDDSDQEFVEKTQLLEWLEREGAELFRDRMEESCPTDDAHEMAEYIFAKTVEKRWLTLAPADAADEDDQDMELYTLRLSTTEAYQIYVEKDSEPSSGLGARTASNRSRENVESGDNIQFVAREEVYPTNEGTISSAPRQTQTRRCEVLMGYPRTRRLRTSSSSSAGWSSVGKRKENGEALLCVGWSGGERVLCAGR
ncbi:hypothetical protein PINS_up004767 [Pythium insidiosum]|nr:hypothetical protein PINS_up004767 [Pythium insidiosum]